MTNELIINSGSSGVTIALLRDKKLVELHNEQEDSNFTVGDIYLGTVKKIMPGLNAAFVDVGHEKDAFLHYLDLGPQVKSLLKFTRSVQQGGMKSGDLTGFTLEPDIIKTGKIGSVLSKGQQVVVQVAKEPISSKGPRISTDLSLAGRYLVLVPFVNTVSVSKKIGSLKERTRLKNLALSIKPANFGVIIRTVAEEKSVEELHKDMLSMVEKWELMTKHLLHAKPRTRLLGELSRTNALIRDLLNDDFTQIVTNDHVLYEDICAYIRAFAPENEKIVRMHSGKTPVFEQYGVDKQIKTLFGKTVSVQGGSYLVIEHTEALHVIDVNSGSKSLAGENQDQNALAVNLEAAKEVARQLRLRDMGGIIVVDFIDMRQAGFRKQVYEALKDAMKSDRAKHKILPMSPFGLVQITRQRVRPEMNIITAEVCPMCKGSGQITPSLLLVDDIEGNLDYLLKNLNAKKITLSVHPYIASFLTKGWLQSPRWHWYKKYKQWVKINSNNNFHMGEYKFYNGTGEEIKL